METKNIKEIKETIKADLTVIKNHGFFDDTIIRDYRTSDGTVFLQATIDYFNIGINIDFVTTIWANDSGYSLTEDFETAWNDMVKNYSDYEVERLRKEIENKWKINGFKKN